MKFKNIALYLLTLFFEGGVFAQITEKEFVIDSNQTIVFQYQDKHLVKIIDNRISAGDNYAYQYCFTKSRLDSIWVDFNPGYLFLASNEKKGLVVLNNTVTKDNLVPFVQENTRRLLAMKRKSNPKFVFTGSDCKSSYLTNSRSSHFMTVDYDVCNDGQITSIKENNIQEKNGVEINIYENNFIKNVETFKNNDLEGIHLIFKKNGKIKFGFICKDGIRYNWLTYKNILKLRKSDYNIDYF